ncbi:hypothetical protein PMAYCL1PPCAC_27398 [Pristionchus mayeri]|uniref:SXP/RAL-2 family protein Ani s 5-like cation-binding domain-containing protein n=1 Tax=Pristionchus mayeri TaxID=1317129 RepID=A0AAN5D619_9BILA|nr:hypothetical protein PMAYCL1PPCAC_27398 [Pristionchus mayeri]
MPYTAYCIRIPHTVYRISYTVYRTRIPYSSCHPSPFSMHRILLVSSLLAVAFAQYGGGYPQQQQQGNGYYGQQQQWPQQQQQPMQQQNRYNQQQQYQPQQYQQQQQQQYQQQPQQQQQQYGNNNNNKNGRGMTGGANKPDAPPFLQNLTSQAVTEYNKIKARNVTKDQITEAVGNWSTTYNVTEQVTAYTTKLELARQNVSAAAEQLPTILGQIFKFMADENLTPSQERASIEQLYANLTYPLTTLTKTALIAAKNGGEEKTEKGKLYDDKGEIIPSRR